MRNTWIVAKRELGAIFVQPIAYVSAIVYILITGYIFAQQLSSLVIQPGSQPVTVENALGVFSFLYVFLAPAVTMRLLSEEQRSGTMELLMTLPVRDGEVIIGKFLAVFLFYLSTVAMTLIFPLILLQFGNPDKGPILTAYLGIILWGASLLSIGTLASALTDDQIVSFMLAFGINLILYLTGIAVQFFAVGSTITIVLNELSFVSHLNSFMRGLIVAKDAIYYVMTTAVMLFAAARVLESRRWR
jgi:ABC-2 type transport system permease protein